VRKSDLEALAQRGGLTVEGNETISELAEAIGFLVEARRNA